MRQEKLQGDWSAYKNAERQAHSMGLLCLDADRKPISGLHSARYYHAGIDSLTTLAAPLAPGDKVVYLRNAQGWNERDNAYYNRGLIIFGYRSSEGRHHSYYSRIVRGNRDCQHRKPRARTAQLLRAFRAASNRAMVSNRKPHWWRRSFGPESNS